MSGIDRKYDKSEDKSPPWGHKRIVALHLGTQDVMQIIVDFLGPKCPKVNPALKDPGTTLALALYDAFADYSGAQLNKLLKQLKSQGFNPSTLNTSRRQIKEIVTDMLGLERVDNPHHYLAAWKMWPLSLTRREETTMKKQATKKKASSKRVASKKKTVAKKTASKKKATGRKGKPAGTKLKTPVKKDGKRGKVLAKFLGVNKTPEKASTELKTTRSNVLSHLHDLNKYHGIGYELEHNGPVKILLPKGCRSPWA